MKLPVWNTHSDPEYLRVRGMILRFFSHLTRMTYRDGRLTMDQEDDVQDAFEAYFTKVLPKTRRKDRHEVVLYRAVQTLVDLRKKKSRIMVGGVEVPRQKVRVR